jgi:hypothetical protein
MYRHYKGGLYQCHGVGMHTETRELLVVYRHSSGNLYFRPLDVWNEPTASGEERFTLLPEAFKLPPL